EITSYSVRHESVAGFMADVYYRVAGRPAMTFTSCGPGSANIPVCLANAYFDSVPYLAITGNVPTTQFNRGAFQETYRHYQADFTSALEALPQASIPAHAGRASATLHAPGVENHGHWPPRTGRARRAVRYFQGRSRYRNAPGKRLERQHLVPLRRRSRRGSQSGRHAT